jgi:hypothetical protein
VLPSTFCRGLALVPSFYYKYRLPLFLTQVTDVTVLAYIILVVHALVLYREELLVHIRLDDGLETRN